MVPGGEAAAPAASGGGAPGSPAGGADQGSLAGVLAAALTQRKKKVSGSGKFDTPSPVQNWGFVLFLLCTNSGV